MKKIFFLLLLISSINYSQINFDEYFENKTLRVDYFHTGDWKTELFSLDEFKQEPYFAGSQKNLIDKFNYGKYFGTVYDSATNKLIYSKGFSTLFGEWQTTAEAKNITKTFSETFILPFPKKTVRIEFQTRNDKNIFEKKFEFFVNPKNYFISPELEQKFNSFDVHISAEPKNAVDIYLIHLLIKKIKINSTFAELKHFQMKAELIFPPKISGKIQSLILHFILLIWKDI